MDACHEHAPSVTVPVTDEAMLKTLPTGPPAIRMLEFTQRGEGWPPMPRGWQEVRRLHAQEMPGSLTADMEHQVREAVVRDPRVQELLGERYVHIGSDAVTRGKGAVAICSEPLAIRLTFYSYARNAAVEVLTRGIHVHSATLREGYQPAETHEEIEEAICLARADCRLVDHVQLLAGSAILLHSSAEEPGYGHRTLWVTFMDPADIEDEKPALFSAAVDLVDRVVLVARAEPPIPSVTGGTSDA